MQTTVGIVWKIKIASQQYMFHGKRSRKIYICNIHASYVDGEYSRLRKGHRWHIYSALSTQHLNFRWPDSIPLYSLSLCVVRFGSDSCNSLYSSCPFLNTYAHIYIHVTPRTIVFKIRSDPEWGQIFAHSDISHSFAVRPNILPTDYWKSATNDWLHKIWFTSPPFFHPTFDARHVSKRKMPNFRK